MGVCVLSINPFLFLLDYTIRIGSTPTFLYLDLFLYSAYTDFTRQGQPLGGGGGGWVFI